MVNNSDYILEYNLNLTKAKEAIINKKNVIICGVARSGKTHIKNKLIQYNLLNDYEIYYGIEDYQTRNTLNGRHYSNNKFWIEEQNKDLIANVLDDYEFIETNLQYIN